MNYKKMLFYVLGVLLLIKVLFLYPFFTSLEYKAQDSLFRFRGKRPLSDKIAIVAIDDATFSSLNITWPFPREYHAKLIDNLIKAGAKQIVFDIEFTESSNEESDESLALSAAMANNVIFAGKVLHGQSPIEPSQKLTPITPIINYDLPWGIVNMSADSDGFIRKYILFEEFDKEPVYSIGIASLANLRVYQPDWDAHIKLSRQALHLSDKIVPVFKHNNAIINYHGPAGTFDSYSYSSVLDDSTFSMPGFQGAELDEFNKNIQIAIAALENTNDELKKSHTVTASMLKLTKEVLINEQIEAVMQLVLDEALNLIPHGQAGSILILKEGNKMDYVAAKGYLLENLKRIDLRYEDLFQAHFDDPYEPNIIRNLKVFDEVHIGQEKTKIIFEEAKKVAKSCLTCSFKYEDKFYGSINLDNFDSDNIYTEKDSYLLKQLAQELEIIISIHHLYEKAIRPTKYDALTQAYTRTYCMKLLKKLIEVNHKTHIGVCTIDINQLKTINDRFGHDVGDQYLAFFADAVRKSNSHESIFGRIGGDEFLLVFAGQDLEHCNLEIENIRQYLKKNKFKTNGFQAEITFSSGLAMYPDESKDIAELTKISDRKMYEDKRLQNI